MNKFEQLNKYRNQFLFPFFTAVAVNVGASFFLSNNVSANQDVNALVITGVEPVDSNTAIVVGNSQIPAEKAASEAAQSASEAIESASQASDYVWQDNNQIAGPVNDNDETNGSQYSNQQPVTSSPGQGWAGMTGAGNWQDSVITSDTTPDSQPTYSAPDTDNTTPAVTNNNGKSAKDTSKSNSTSKSSGSSSSDEDDEPDSSSSSGGRKSSPGKRWHMPALIVGGVALVAAIFAGLMFRKLIVVKNGRYLVARGDTATFQPVSIDSALIIPNYFTARRMLKGVSGYTLIPARKVKKEIRKRLQ